MKKVANANRDATGLVHDAIRADPNIYPPDDVMHTLRLVAPEPPEYVGERARMWTRVRDRPGGSR